MTGEELVPGIMVAIQTFGDRINFHPHLTCPCQEGCPSCVGPARETGRQAKQVAQEILRGLLEE